MDSPILLYHEVYIWIHQFLCARIARLASRRSSIYHSPRVFHNEKPDIYNITNNQFATTKIIKTH